MACLHCSTPRQIQIKMTCLECVEVFTLHKGRYQHRFPLSSVPVFSVSVSVYVSVTAGVNTSLLIGTGNALQANFSCVGSAIRVACISFVKFQTFFCGRILKQELHSSRMHTARLLTVSRSMHCAGGGICLARGVCLARGGLLARGVSQHALRQTPPL